MKKVIVVTTIIFLASLTLFAWSLPTIDISEDGTEKVYTFKGDPVVTDLGGGQKRTQCTNEPQTNFCRIVRAPNLDQNPAIISSGTRINIFVYNSGQTTINGSGTGYLNVLLPTTVNVNQTTDIDFIVDSQSSIVNDYTTWNNASAPTN